MSKLTAKQFIAAPAPIRLVAIDLPDGVGQLFVKEMTDDELESNAKKVQQLLNAKGDGYGAPETIKRMKCAIAYAMVLAVCDPDTKRPLFKKSDVPALAKKPYGYLVEVRTMIGRASLGMAPKKEDDDPNA